MENRTQYKTVSLGGLASNFFAFTQMRRLEVVRSGELAPALGLNPVQERNLFRRLTRAGWVVRLQRGLFLVPKVLPAGGRWNPSESIVIPALMKALRCKYQISGPTAFNRYGFDDQVSNAVVVYNACLSATRRIGSTRYTFVRVIDGRLGATEKVKTPDGEELYYSSKERTLVDAIYDWSRFNGIPRAFEWVRGELKKGTVRAPALARIAVQYGNQATLRRLGWILQKNKVSPGALQIIRQALRNSNSPISMIPYKPRKGPIVKAWGIIDNE
ncbi:MAG TPA: type IV toxin-antitoxin system AbiEi family antitoxin domain-containing protein [Candidatus Omnitrophota bacterium]|nr:type IV toxin-antitoxin system AbiEi family antitoxin domain-containing protein [Candidatus Omnitrophota bacterium]